MSNDPGRTFEVRALALARAKHDPLDLQGAHMEGGIEYDGVFVDDQSIAVYEFTTEKKKEKAIKDASKIVSLLKQLAATPANRFKGQVGYFVTQGEPTADQRGAVREIAARAGLQIHCMSFLSLQKSLVDVEGYISKRCNVAFGSADSLMSGRPEQKYILPKVKIGSEQTVFSAGLLPRIDEAKRVLVVGDFGLGKSEALRRLFWWARQAYFKEPDQRRFPVHINLRDMVGLRTPREIFQRHAEEIGYSGSGGLISAWRAGLVDLLLDGFDELVPARLVGSPRNLQATRRETLACVRKLVQDTPVSASVVLCGRPQYFGSPMELRDSMGMEESVTFDLQDFDSEQVAEYVGGPGVPAWLPTRPLLVKLYAENADEGGEYAEAFFDRAVGWRSLIDAVCSRESKRVDSVSSGDIGRLIARVSLMARAESDGVGPVALDSMRQAFRDVCGYEADEDGLQALLRLPGLTSTTVRGGEARIFADQEFADAVFAGELSDYIGNPHGDSPLKERAKWSASSSLLTIEVAASSLERQGFSPGAVMSCLDQRNKDAFFDALLFDVVRVAEVMGSTAQSKAPIHFADILVERLEISREKELLLRSTWSGCVIEELDVTEMDDSTAFPSFASCQVGSIVGWDSIPDLRVGNFGRDTRVDHFEPTIATTSSLLTAPLSDAQRVALTILKKVYAQAGSARRVSSLSRGIPLDLRGMVESVLQELASGGLVTLGQGKGERLAAPVGTRRAEVGTVLSYPRSIDQYLS